MRATMEADGWLCVSVPPLGPAVRGQLGSRIEEAIETSLHRRGVPPSALDGEYDAQRLMRDQLSRAQRVGIRRIAVSLESLSGLIGPHGALGDEDSESMRLLISMADSEQFELWLSPTDTELRAYGPPVPLRQLTLSPHANLPIEADLHTVSQESEQPSCPSEELDANWRVLARMLDEAKGPKPLGTIEKLFLSAYVPLSELVRKREIEPKGRESLARFSASFEKSYKEAFAAAKVTQKRPLMVFDVPAIASRVARNCGARCTMLVLVDGMRYDVALRLERLLRTELRGKIELAERFVLWAALPATTPVQLRLLDKGLQALSAHLDTLELRESEVPIGIGRTASTIRRFRVGGRDLHKLDVIQSDLRAPGLPESTRLDALAQAAAYPLIQLIPTLAPRTLMFVFGDHGFVLPSTETGTDSAEMASGRPEEVLVAGQAWIVGDGA